jgi:sec-independent protein translocase protein TatA
MFGLPGGSEWIVILLIVVLLFGARKIPDLMKGLGSGIREFKKAASGDPADDAPKKTDTPS